MNTHLLEGLTAGLVGGVVMLLVFILWLGSRSTTSGKGAIPADRDAHRRFLYLKLFYVNPDDPRGWLPKIYGIGYTVNFRVPLFVHIFIVLIVAVLVAATVLTCAAFP